MKKVMVLGSTGSLGQQILQLLHKHRNSFRIVALAANKSEELLSKQAADFRVPLAALYGKGQTLSLDDADIVINLFSGIAGIAPSKEALKKGKILLLANKESVVAEGLCHKNIIPLDSEHNAIFEILQKFPDKKVRKIFIPCSGGPFWKMKKSELEKVTPAMATRHPKWKMGPKISVESATLINKGLEIIEAHYLFQLPFSKIKVFLHPECQIHGMVEFEDRVLAYFGQPDMSEHLENALLRTIGKVPRVDIQQVELSKINIVPPHNKNLPGIETVLAAFKSNPRKMSNFLREEEKIIHQFLSGKIKFTEIFKILQNAAPR